MSLLITRTQGVGSCTVIGYRNPTWYSFTQYTGQYDGVTLDGAYTKVQPNGGTANYLVGDKIRLRSISTETGFLGYFGDIVYDVVIKDATYLYCFVQLGGVGNNTPGYNGQGTGYIVNMSTNQRLQIQTRLKNWTGAIISKSTTTWFPRPDMSCIVDLQSELQSLFYTSRDFFSYSINPIVHKQVGQYVLEYREVYYDRNFAIVEGSWAQINEDVLAIPGRKEIREAYGNNFKDYAISTGLGFANANFEDAVAGWFVFNGNVGATPYTRPWSWGPFLIFVTVTETERSQIFYQQVQMPPGTTNFTIDIAAPTNNLTFRFMGSDDGFIWTQIGSLSVAGGTPQGIITHDVVTTQTWKYVGFACSVQATLGYTSVCNINEFRFTNPSTEPGNFLTRFAAGKAFLSQQRPLTYAIDPTFVDAVATYDIVMDYFDVSGAPIGTYTVGGVTTAAGLFSVSVDPDQFAGAHTIEVRLEQAGGGAIYIQPYTLNVVEPCRPYLLLEWQNALGGYNQWLFDRVHIVNMEALDKPAATENYEYDIANSKGNLSQDGSDWWMKVDCTDEFVPSAEALFLAEIKYTKHLRLILGNGVDLFCIPLTANTPWRSDTNITKFQLSVRLPRNFNPLLIDPNLTTIDIKAQPATVNPSLYD